MATPTAKAATSTRLILSDYQEKSGAKLAPLFILAVYEPILLTAVKVVQIADYLPTFSTGL